MSHTESILIKIIKKKENIQDYFNENCLKLVPLITIILEEKKKHH